MSKIGWAGIGSAIAVAVSLLALFVSFYQARIAEQQAHAAVWPYLTIGYDISDEGPDRGFTWQVVNDGLGPAIIQSVIVRVDGKPMHTWDEVCRALGIQNLEFSATRQNLSGRVQPPDTNRDTAIDAFHAASMPEAKIFLAARKRLAMDICYCSVYQECWIAHFMQQKVDRVPRCDSAGADQFGE